MSGDEGKQETGEVEEGDNPEADSEIIEFLKLVEQARAEQSEAPVPETLGDASLKDLPRPKKYKFGLKAKNERKPILVIIREAQHTKISPAISVTAILVALFVLCAAVAATGY